MNSSQTPASSRCPTAHKRKTEYSRPASCRTAWRGCLARARWLAFGAFLLVAIHGFAQSNVNSSYIINIPNGYSLIANQLDHGSNTVPEIIPYQDGDNIGYWNGSAWDFYTMDSLSGTGWIDPAFNEVLPLSLPKLTPGKGFLYGRVSGPTNITFTGTPHVPVLPVSLPNGYGSYYSLARQTNGLGTYENITGLAPQDGALVLTWNGASYVTNAYTGGVWTSGTPSLAVGQAAVFYIPPPPCTGNLVVNGGFETTSPAVPPNTPLNNLNRTTGVPGWTSDVGQTLEVWGNVVNALPASVGTNHMEINAQSNDQTVTQTITNLSTNCVVQLCFDYAGRFGIQGSNYNNDFTFSVSGGYAHSVDLNPPTYAGTWTNYCVSFIPSSPSVTISFRGHPHFTNGIATQGGAHIDNVSLVQCCTNTAPCITMTCASNKTVACGSSWSFDAPTNIVDSCCTNYVVNFTTVTNNAACPVMTRTWTVSDSCGNSNSCSQIVTIATPPPVIFAPSEIVVETCSNSIPVQFCVTATNVCLTQSTNWCATCPTAFVSSYPPSGSLFGLGTNTVVCFASDICGKSNSTTFIIVVLPSTNCCVLPVVVSQPQDVIVSPDGTALLAATATGTPPLSFQWLHFGSNVVANATNSTLSIAPVAFMDAGEYSLQVSNACGSTTSAVAQITVTADYLPDVALTAQVDSHVVVAGQATYTLTAENVGAFLLSGQVISGTFSGVPASFIEVKPSGTVVPSGNDFNLTINLPDMAVGTSLTYTVTFQVNEPGTLNFSGSIAAAPGEVNISDNSASTACAFGYAPQIVNSPVGFTGAPGGTGSLSATATGSGTLGWIWLEDGVDNLAPAGDTLNFPELHASDAGDYQAMVTNEWGSAISATATVTLTFGPQVTASISSRVVKVIGSVNVDDIEVRRNAATDGLEIDDLSNGVGTDFSFADADYDKLVIELGNQDNKLVFNDAGGTSIVTALNKQFEIYGGVGSNVVIASSAGIDQNALPGLMTTLHAAPDFEVLTTNLHYKSYTNILAPSVDWALQVYDDIIKRVGPLRDEAMTNPIAKGSNLVYTAQAVAAMGRNYLEEASWRFNTPGYPSLQFSNCLMNLVAQLNAMEDSAADTEGESADPTDEAMENLSDQIDGLIDSFEAGSVNFEGNLEMSGDSFYASVASNLETPADILGGVDGPATEAAADSYAALADLLQTVQAVAAEEMADIMSARATQLEIDSEALSAQAESVYASINAFTTAADPTVEARSVPLTTGTQAGCDQNLSANNKIVIKVGGLIIGTPFNDKIIAKPNTFLILGLGGNDFIVGNNSFNLIHSGSGDDEVHGLGGVDLLFGAGGNDCLFGDEDFDLLFGGNGNDNLHGGTNIDLILGGNGNDKIFGDENLDVLLGGSGDDTMEGGDGIDLMFGGPGADTMKGGSGHVLTSSVTFICDLHLGNLMIGGADNDKMYGGDDMDVMFGLGGADEMFSSNHVDVVFGNAGNDKIYGGDGGPLVYFIVEGVKYGIRMGNVMFGGPDNDEITGGRDADVAFGGTGNDNIRGSYTYPFWKYPKLACDCGDVDTGLDNDVIFGGEGDDTLDGGYGTDIVFGGPGADLIKGNGEAAKLLTAEIGLLFGNGGNDTIIGGKFDTITLAFGGNDDDTVIGSKWGVMNMLFGNAGQDTVTGNGDLTTLAFGGPDADTVTGGGYTLDLLFGGTGNDNIQGGNYGVLDILFGQAGDDVITGNGSLVELQFGNSGSDIMNSGPCLSYLMFGNDDCDYMTGNAVLGLMFGNAKDDTMTGGFGVDIMFGNDGPDLMNGGGGPDVMFGNGGDDDLSGGAWPDVMLGNGGDDTLHGNDGPDIILGNSGDDHVYGDADPDLLFGGAGHDVVAGGSSLDLIFGGSSGDCLSGDSGNDLIFGGADDDFIHGDADGDLLFGNRGNDTIYGDSGANLIFGNRDNDIIVTSGNDDRAWGNRDNDSFQNTANDARLRGNRDNDQFNVAGGSGVRVYGGLGTDTYAGSPAKHRSASSGTVSFTIPTPNCAEIHGLVWFDASQDGTQNNGESGVPGVVVFLDLNNNGIQNGGEPFVLTMADDPATCQSEAGRYWFTDLAPGTYHVRQVLGANTHQTYPGGSHDVTLGFISVVTGRDFGHAPTNSASPVVIDGVGVNRQNGTVVINGSGAIANQACYLLTATNLAQPVVNWQVIATNVFPGNGSFSLTNAVPLNDRQRFFRLQMP